MPEAMVLDWASRRRRRWSAPRIAAALALHLALLAALLATVDRVRLPRHAAERATTLVTVTLHRAPPPPPPHALPPPRPATPAVGHARPRAARTAPAPACTPARDDAGAAVTLPRSPAEAQAAVGAAPPASAPQADLSFLDGAATRAAIRDAARGRATLAGRANAITGDQTTAGERLARNVDAAHKGDCMKGEYLGGGMGLLSAPFLLAAEALGKCSAK